MRDGLKFNKRSGNPLDLIASFMKTMPAERQRDKRSGNPLESDGCFAEMMNDTQYKSRDRQNTNQSGSTLDEINAGRMHYALESQENRFRFSLDV